MTSSSSALPERGLDTMILVYSLIQGHPAAISCEQLIRNHTGWFTTALVLFEAKAVLTKVYGVDPTLTSRKLTQFAAGPISLIEVDRAVTQGAFSLADTAGMDLTDAVLLFAARQIGARWLATDDQRLAQDCAQFGITPISPLDAGLRQQVAAWENAHVSQKGLPRVLHRIHTWLNQSYPQAAQDFWSQTGAGSHLP